MKQYSEKLLFGINELIEPNYFLQQADSYSLEETEETGRSVLKVNVSSESTSICVANYDKKKRCSFINIQQNNGLGKCVDHALLLKKQEKWTLVLIEMKKNIGEKTWLNIKQKVRSSYLSMMALCIYLDINIDDVKVYTTYETEKFYSYSDTNPSIKKANLGKRKIDSKKDEWDKNIIHINLYEEQVFEYHPIKMKSDNNILTSEISI